MGPLFLAWCPFPPFFNNLISPQCSKIRLLAAGPLSLFPHSSTPFDTQKPENKIKISISTRKYKRKSLWRQAQNIVFVAESSVAQGKVLLHTWHLYQRKAGSKFRIFLHFLLCCTQGSSSPNIQNSFWLPSISPTCEDSMETALKSSIIFGTFGAFTLIVPMLLMALHTGRTISVVDTSVAVAV